MGNIGSRAVRVACIALGSVLVSASAVAASSDYFLKIEGVDGESKNEKHKGEIEIQSFSWGVSQSTHHGSGMGTGKVSMQDMSVMRAADPPASSAAPGSGMGAGKVNMQDMSVMRGPRQTTAADGVQVASGDVDGDGRADAATGKFGAVSGVKRADGLASVKRTHPALIKITKPLATGSISLNMRLPGCAVGTRYPSAELTTPTGRYSLRGLVVASCDAEPRGSAPMERVTLNYAKVGVRAWNPTTKQE